MTSLVFVRYSSVNVEEYGEPGSSWLVAVVARIPSQDRKNAKAGILKTLLQSCSLSLSPFNFLTGFRMDFEIPFLSSLFSISMRWMTI